MSRRAVSARRGINAPAEVGPLVFPIYYLWWIRSHWDDTLGAEYMASAAANNYPVPGVFSDGDTDTVLTNTCAPITNPGTGLPFVDDTMLDVSQAFAYSQDQGTTVEDDMDLMYAIGCRGVAPNWATIGQTNYTNRMARVIDKTDAMVGQGKKFHVILNYKGESSRPGQNVLDDLSYYLDTHGARQSIWRFRGKPIIIWTGSWNYFETDLQLVCPTIRQRAWLIAGQQYHSWPISQNSKQNGVDVSQYFDGNAPYWSGQDPYKNPASFNQLKTMSTAIHNAGKIYGAPLSPGYDDRLFRGSVPVDPGDFHVIRKQGETIQRIWDGNIQGNPDFWMQISWNEIRENSHIVPLKRYGTLFTDILEGLISGDPSRLY